MSVFHPYVTMTSYPSLIVRSLWRAKQKLAVGIEGQSSSEGTSEAADFVAVENSPANKKPVLHFRHLP